MNPKFNMENIEAMIGRGVIVDLTTRESDEAVVERTQLYGEVIRVSGDEGIVLKLHDSEREYILPPNVDDFEQLAPGTYHLEPEGTVIENPDLRTTMVVHRPPPEYSGPVRNERDKEAGIQD